jgi:hypothetical protein
MAGSTSTGAFAEMYVLVSILSSFLF